MSAESLHTLYLAVWIVGIWGLLKLSPRIIGRMTVGLPLAYLLLFFTSHWLGAAIYNLPWYYPPNPALFTMRGFQMSTLGFVVFVIASLATQFLYLRHRLPQASIPPVIITGALPLRFAIIGLLFYFVITPVVGSIPSIGSIANTFNQLWLIGAALLVYQSRQSRNIPLLILGVALLGMIPLTTTVLQGFLGFGITSATIAITFLWRNSHLKIRHVGFALVALYLALTMYTTYTRDRDMIRESVWGGEDLAERVDVLSSTARTFEWFNPRDIDHLDRIDMRLNHNFYVGAAYYYLQARYTDFANGSTIVDAVTAFIPRVLWENKSVRAGGSSLITQYTGIYFNDATSIMPGQPMEFYFNFGYAGIVGGFIVLAVVLTVLDFHAAGYLFQGETLNFVRFYLIGMALLQPGSSLTEVMLALASAIVAAFILRFVPKGDAPLLQGSVTSHKRRHPLPRPMIHGHD